MSIIIFVLHIFFYFIISSRRSAELSRGSASVSVGNTSPRCSIVIAICKKVHFPKKMIIRFEISSVKNVFFWFYVCAEIFSRSLLNASATVQSLTS